MEIEKQELEKKAIYIGNNKNAKTFKNILKNGGVGNFENMIGAFDNETLVKTFCCVPIKKSPIKASDITAKTKPIKDLFEIIEKKGTLSVYPDLPSSLMGTIFLLKEEKNKSKESSTSESNLESNNLINWVMTEKKAGELLQKFNTYNEEYNSYRDTHNKLVCIVPKDSQFLTLTGKILVKKDLKYLLDKN